MTYFNIYIFLISHDDPNVTITGNAMCIYLYFPFKESETFPESDKDPDTNQPPTTKYEPDCFWLGRWLYAASNNLNIN